MFDLKSYSYPLNGIHPYPTDLEETVADPHNKSVLQQGALVQITRGPLKGLTGKLSGCTKDGIYFIQGDDDNWEVNRNLLYHGPFLRDEFELFNYCRVSDFLSVE